MSEFRTIEIADKAYVRDNLHFMAVKSENLRGRGDICFFIPETNETDLPMAILLHGVYGSSWSWAFSGGAHVVAQDMIDKGEIPPVVLAMPSDGLTGDGSAYIKHDTKNYENWIVDDVPAAARKMTDKFSENSKMYIAGLSMGGFGALRLGSKYPDRFNGISGHSSVTEFNLLQQFVEEELQDSFAFDDVLYSPLYWMKKHRDQLPPLRFDCGVDDELIEGNRTLHRQLEEEGIRHIYEEYSGAHTWDYWHEHLRDSLKFLLS
jgi:putative tributyrin esterase